MAKD
ncbi:hypothetical protein VCHENC02_3471A, partial [Vibrio harveyi]|jgi:hypothetical protein